MKAKIILFTGIIFVFLNISKSINYPSNSGFSELLNDESIRLDPIYLQQESQWVDSVFHSLSNDEKIAQLMMIAAYSNRGSDHLKDLQNVVQRYNVGGLIFFQGGPLRQAQMTNELQSVSKTPLMIGIDAEWGLSMRLDSTVKYPFAMTLGAIQDNQLIYAMGADMARQMDRMGIHINFAPVIDVNNNPNNPVINTRSFGEDPVNVARKGIAYMMGLQDNHILANAKHFPGHGDTDTDSHHALPVIKHTKKRLDSIELYPFKRLINAGLSSVMVAHLNIPSLDSTPNQASTLSKPIISGVLKEELNFKGLVITDALNMKGVSDYNDPGELEVKALQAGNDVLLMPDNVPRAISAIKKALSQDRLMWEDINQSVKKILAAKFWAGLNNYHPINMNGLYQDLNTRDSELLIRQLAEEAITLVKNKGEFIPLKRLDTLEIASISFGERDKSAFQLELDLYTDVDHFHYDQYPSQYQLNDLEEKLKNYNLVIISVLNTDLRASRKFGISDASIAFIDKIMKHKNVVLNVFTNPYSLKYFNHLDSAKAIVMSYQDMEAFQRVSAQVIFGGLPSKGVLPVTVHNMSPSSCHETFGRKRLSYTYPELAGIPESSLIEVEEIIQKAINDRAMPGCQVLAALDGKVFYHKAFGSPTYQKKRQVTTDDLYDLASITKITATLPFLMREYEKEEILLTDKLSQHITWLDTTNKKDMIIGDILTHQAGLEPWIPFYLKTIEQLFPEDPLYNRDISPDYPFRLSKYAYLNRHIKHKEHVFDINFSPHYPLKVGKNMYLRSDYRDTIYYSIANSETNGREYKYSDLGYYLFYELLDKKYEPTFYEMVDSMFYAPLGSTSLGYLPLNRFDKEQIIPTENDLIFRKQLVQGTVHDPGAAMMGGICGHAGLFSNANDLAKIMQMYLWKGSYGGEKYFESQTLETFTSCPNCNEGNRRGYGFDKPKLPNHRYGPSCDQASPSSYGHSGFTGTLTWVDPETGLLFIFLSNRIHPDASNTKLISEDIRTRIQEVFYKAVE